MIIQKETSSIQELVTTLQKLITQDISGIEKYINGDVNIVHQTLSYSDERFELKEQVGTFMEPFSTNPKFKNVAISILEELFTNAFYSAPVDTEGHQPYDHQGRLLPVQLPSDKIIGCSYAFDGRYLILSVAYHDFFLSQVHSW